MDVAHADAAEVGRLLARQRWGSRGVDRAIETLQQRQDELSEWHLTELRQLAGAAAVNDKEVSGG